MNIFPRKRELFKVVRRRVLLLLQRDGCRSLLSNVDSPLPVAGAAPHRPAPLSPVLISDILVVGLVFVRPPSSVLVSQDPLRTPPRTTTRRRGQPLSRQRARRRTLLGGVPPRHPPGCVRQRPIRRPRHGHQTHHHRRLSTRTPRRPRPRPSVAPLRAPRLPREQTPALAALLPPVATCSSLPRFPST